VRDAGLWIDHRQAQIATMEDGRVRIRRIVSHVGRKTRLAGGSRSAGFIGEIAPEKRREDRYANKLRSYYQRVLDAIHDADRVMILGPGEAKLELKKALSKSKRLSSIRIDGVEPADKMTRRQLVAKVTTHFSRAGRRSSGIDSPGPSDA